MLAGGVEVPKRQEVRVSFVVCSRSDFDSKWCVSTRNLVPVDNFVSFTFYSKLMFCLNMNAFVSFMMMCE